MGVSIDAAVRFTRVSVYLAHSWPSSKTSTKKQNVKLQIIWYVSVATSVGLLVPLLLSMYTNQSNSLVFTQSACFVGAICNYLAKMIAYRMQRRRTQILISEMEDFLKAAKPHEKKVLEDYVGRTLAFHVLITAVNYVTALGVICGPLFLPQEFPTDAAYPFSVDSRFVKYAIYLHQSFVGFQCSTGATIDCQTALMLWFAGARLEILTLEIKNVSDLNSLRCFVQKHQRLLSYAREVCHTASYIVLTTSIACGFGTIFSGLQLLSNQPLAVKIQFGPVVLVAGMNLFVCCWPADNLIRVCDMMGDAVWDASWPDESSRMMKNYSMILHRSQRPVIVSIAGFIPVLSLRSYATYLSSAFSYTTTLRLVLNTNPEIQQ
ncbi:uncharacterized protein [Venturia canescens]|uniref:uncharacterized protein n=1 Tax=Venturia canescens TaxID=32260 RepID=UPI001C9CC3DF|nr:uncharacterized protein LOC122416210 [Venturia canescens]